jgi:hypothetical protein
MSAANHGKAGATPCDVPCVLHDGVEKNVDCLFEKSSKMIDRMFWIMLILCLNSFLTGLDVAMKLINAISLVKVPH